MQIESLHIQNFRVFQDVLVENIPQMAVFVGQNGVGKTTFFDVFGFLHDCLTGNVQSALSSRGSFQEVISRDQSGDICFTIKFRPSPNEPMITYELTIGLDEKSLPVVKKEVMRFRRGQSGSPWKILDFAYGEGFAASGLLQSYQDVQMATRSRQKVSAPNILAIKGLGQFEDFPAVGGVRPRSEGWGGKSTTQKNTQQTL